MTDLFLDANQQYDEPDYIDLQTRILHLEDELVQARKKLAVTQTIYRNLESEYVSLTSRTTALIVIPGELRVFQTRKAVDDIAASIRQAVRNIDVPANSSDTSRESPLLYIRQSDYSRLCGETEDALDATGSTLYVSAQEEDACAKLRGLIAAFYPTALVPRIHIVVAESNCDASIDLIASMIATKLNSDADRSNTRQIATTASRERSHTSASSISSISRRTSIATSISQPLASLHNATGGLHLLLYDISSKDGHAVQDVFRGLKSKLLSLLDVASETYVDVSEVDLTSLIYHSEISATSADAPNNLSPEQDTILPERASIPRVSPHYAVSATGGATIPEGNPVNSAASPPRALGWASIVRGNHSQLPTSAPLIPSTDNRNTSKAQTAVHLQSGIASADNVPLTHTVQIYRDADARQRESNENRRMSEASSSTSTSMHGRAASNHIGSTSTGTTTTHIRNGSLSSASPPVRLDPNVSLCKQKKPPCNQHYLTKAGCHNPKCNYSHAYQLSNKQLDEMRSGAAKTPCVYRKQGQPCSAGADCVFGHVCPQGSRCKQGGRCHFPASMH